MAFSEMSLKQLDAAAGHAQKAVSLGQDCGNPDFYFDALLTAAEVETTRGNLPAASDYVDRAFALTDQLHDKQQVYPVYGDRADIYYQKALSYDCQKQPDICLQSYDHAKADYQSAQSIAQKLGYTFLAQNYSQQLQTVEAQAAILKRKQGDAPAVPAWMFEPKQPKDVLATEIFATGAADPTTLALIKNAVAEIESLETGPDAPLYEEHARQLYLMSAQVWNHRLNKIDIRNRDYLVARERFRRTGEECIPASIAAHHQVSAAVQ
jgi:tetratricopeptide (TPR) repeat protein